ncbi:MAG: bifunctional methylenetetrahydrofolate dehydrogenase/methenyltetrahydrofolate cyclohydrolase FolD [Bacteroidales bacterium]|nr:bifunctional methylenetetrahydrofolate dehydrogenase/methenyltetrahydrofolate cyclohydrolase FolD [Bacteroidales bacterium]
MTISGKELADSIIGRIASEVEDYHVRFGRVPALAVILVGEDPASKVYVRNKTRACERAGIRHIEITLPEDTSELEILENIEALNADPSVDGILVQLPLPAHLSESHITGAIAREKDVDGFHPLNVAALWLGRDNAKIEEHYPVACTPRGIMRILEAAGVDPAGKRAVVIGRSNIVGLPIAKLLLNANATVTICHSRTKDIAEITRQADILVAAIGKPKFVGAEMVRDSAVVVDVGINRLPDGKLCGDVDFEAVAPRASVITPVPGGVGPMTVCSLMENTIDCYLRHTAKRKKRKI